MIRSCARISSTLFKVLYGFCIRVYFLYLLFSYYDALVKLPRYARLNVKLCTPHFIGVKVS